MLESQRPADQRQQLFDSIEMIAIGGFAGVLRSLR
jgi:hypothetical protein